MLTKVFIFLLLTRILVLSVIVGAVYHVYQYFRIYANLLVKRCFSQIVEFFEIGDISWSYGFLYIQWQVTGFCCYLKEPDIKVSFNAMQIKFDLGNWLMADNTQVKLFQVVFLNFFIFHPKFKFTDVVNPPSIKKKQKVPPADRSDKNHKAAAQGLTKAPHATKSSSVIQLLSPLPYFTTLFDCTFQQGFCFQFYESECAHAYILGTADKVHMYSNGQMKAQHDTSKVACSKESESPSTSSSSSGERESPSDESMYVSCLVMIYVWDI